MRAVGTITHICVLIATSGFIIIVNAARYPARDFGLIVAIRNDFTNNEPNENSRLAYLPASIKPLNPIYIRKIIPIIFKVISVSGVFINMDESPRIVSAKNSIAWLNIAATQTKLFLKPNSLATAMQLTAFGPGIVTKSAQNPVKIIHSSKDTEKSL